MSDTSRINAADATATQMAINDAVIGSTVLQSGAVAKNNIQMGVVSTQNSITNTIMSTIQSIIEVGAGVFEHVLGGAFKAAAVCGKVFAQAAGG